VLFLAGHRAGVAADTSILINDKSVSHEIERDIVLESESSKESVASARQNPAANS
jgi:hypothetical protein